MDIEDGSELQAQAIPLPLLAALGSVGEAAARLVVTGRQRRRPPAPQEGLTEAELELIEARGRAYEIQLMSDRELIELGADAEWLDAASLVDLGHAWRAAVVHGASGYAPGWATASTVEEQLRAAMPSMMEIYDEERADGAGQVQAMRVAVHEMAEQGNRLRELDEALRMEAHRLTENVDPERLRELQREWAAGGQLPAAQAASQLLVNVDRPGPGLEEHLAALAEREHAQATVFYGQSDLPATLPDEHHEGLERGSYQQGRADHDMAAAAAQARRVGRSFPSAPYIPAPRSSPSPSFWGR